MNTAQAESARKIIMIANYLYKPWEKDQIVPSPCVSVCLMDASSHFCDGCFRTLDEIAAWSGMDDDAKRGVWQLLAQRASGALTVGKPVL
jgi:uncharacterized protein